MSFTLRFIAHITTGGARDYVSRTNRSPTVASEFFDAVMTALQQAEDGSMESSLLETPDVLNPDLSLSEYIMHSKRYRANKKAAATSTDAGQPEADEAAPSGSRRSARAIARNASKSSGAEASESQNERERREAQELRFAEDEESVRTQPNTS